MFRLVFISSTLTCCLLVGQTLPNPRPASATITMEFNGKPLDAEVLQWSARPEDDVVTVYPHVMLRGKSPKLSLLRHDPTDRNDLNDIGHSLFELVDGKEQLVAVEVDSRYDLKKRESIFFNPLTQYSNDQLKHLRGITIKTWDPSLLKDLARIDLTNVAVTIDAGIVTAAKDDFPKLPSNLRVLAIEQRSTPGGFRNYDALTSLTNLGFLKIYNVEGFDCKLLRNSKELRWLAMTSSHQKPPRNVSELAGLSKLEYLDLSYNAKLTEIGFARSMTSLRHLDIHWTSIESLVPLGGHPSLETIIAERCRLQSLPLKEKLPKLKSINVLASRVSEADAEAFRTLHPGSTVRSDWMKELLLATKNADRLRVRSGGTCHREITLEKTLFEAKGVDKVEALIKLIGIDPSRSGGHCMCCGEPSFELYQGDKLVLTLGFHHGQAIRWPEGWPGDGALTRDSASKLKAWLEERVPSIKSANDAEAAARRKSVDINERFLACFPASVRPLFQQSQNMSILGDRDDPAQEKKAASIIAKVANAIPNETERLIACCRAFAITDEEHVEWNVVSPREILASAVANKIPSDVIVNVLQVVKDDKQAMSGLAHLFFRQNLNKRLQGDEQNNVRIALARWYIEQGNDVNFNYILDDLKTSHRPEINELLTWIASQPVKSRKDKDEERVRDEPSAPVTAGLELAQRGQKQIIVRLKDLYPKLTGSDKLACELAFAWLDTPVKLNEAHFKNESYVLGYSAINLVKHHQGKKWFDLLVTAGCHHPWAFVNGKAEEAVKELTKKDWKDGYLGDQIEDWWKSDGDAFMTKMKWKKTPK